MSDEPGGSQDGNPNLFRHKQIIITTDIFQSKNQIVLIEDLLLPPFASLSKIILLSFLFVYTTWNQPIIAELKQMIRFTRSIWSAQ